MFDALVAHHIPYKSCDENSTPIRLSLGGKDSLEPFPSNHTLSCLTSFTFLESNLKPVFYHSHAILENTYWLKTELEDHQRLACYRVIENGFRQSENGMRLVWDWYEMEMGRV